MELFKARVPSFPALTSRERGEPPSFTGRMQLSCQSEVHPFFRPSGALSFATYGLSRANRCGVLLMQKEGNDERNMKPGLSSQSESRLGIRRTTLTASPRIQLISSHIRLLALEDPLNIAFPAHLNCTSGVYGVLTAYESTYSNSYEVLYCTRTSRRRLPHDEPRSRICGQYCCTVLHITTGKLHVLRQCPVSQLVTPLSYGRTRLSHYSLALRDVAGRRRIGNHVQHASSDSDSRLRKGLRMACLHRSSCALSMEKGARSMQRTQRFSSWQLFGCFMWCFTEDL